MAINMGHGKNILPQITEDYYKAMSMLPVASTFPLLINHMPGTSGITRSQQQPQERNKINDMSSNPLDPTSNNLPSLNFERHNLSPEDTQIFDLITEFKQKTNEQLKSELKKKIDQLLKERIIAKRVDELKELLSDPSVQNLDAYALTDLISNNYKVPEIKMEKAMKEWNVKFEKENFSMRLGSNPISKLNNSVVDNAVLPKMAPIASTAALSREPSNEYQHKKVNYKNFVPPEIPTNSADLEIDDRIPLSKEIEKRLMLMKKLYYQMGIENLIDNRIHFPLDFKFNEKMHKTQADYQDQARAIKRIKNNIFSRLSANQKKLQIFSITSIVDFNKIMINILQDAIKSATESALELEDQIGDPELIKKFRERCSLKFP